MNTKMINSTYLKYQKCAHYIRTKSLYITSKSGSSHIGSCLSVADILAVIFTDHLKKKNFNNNSSYYFSRLRLIFSKGHAAAALYSALNYIGLISNNKFETYGKNGSQLMTHVSSKVPGVEFSTGSLGHGLPHAIGRALSLKLNNSKSKVICILSDGELNEGSNWEAFQFIAHHKLDNLLIIIDKNQLQGLSETKNIIELSSFSQIMKNFNFKVFDIDGHSIPKIKKSIDCALSYKKNSSIIIANTVKGKGIKFMESKVEWHYKSLNFKKLNEIKIQ